MLACKVGADEEDVDLEGWKKEAKVNLEHLSEKQMAELQEVFSVVPTLFHQKLELTHILQHTIHLNNPTPVCQQDYRAPERLVEPLKEEIHMMIDLGVIEPSRSDWSSPMVIVLKKDRSLRVCIDFRKLNAVSKFDAYPMPHIDDLLQRIEKASYITTLDLCKGYWQVPLEQKSREYTTFRTPMGLYQFTAMLFGLHGAPATFQRLMDQVLQGCVNCCAAYLDDVVIYSNTWN